MDAAIKKPPLAPRPHPLWGAVGGLIFGLFNVLFVLVAKLLGGVALERHGLTLATAAGIYIVGGTIGGALTGLLLPLLRWRLGFAVVGAVAAMPIFLAIATTSKGAPKNWARNTWFAVVVPSILVGGGIGIVNRSFIQGYIAKWPTQESADR